ncbi:MAG: (4Fe-4S)-binding protein [Bacteroidota bacterium]
MSNKINKAELTEIKEKNKGSRSYSNGEVTVYWRPQLCIHSANCLIGLPEVFNNSLRPWIKPEAASTKEIIRVVNTCPSRALTFMKNCGSAASIREKPVPGKSPGARIQILKNGPALVHGSFVISDADGKTLKVEHEVAAICRCGNSKKKPFCDGTHKNIGYED